MRRGSSLLQLLLRRLMLALVVVGLLAGFGSAGTPEAAPSEAGPVLADQEVDLDAETVRVTLAALEQRMQQAEPTLSERALQVALTKIDASYLYGGSGPSRFDCSGLVYWSYKQLGVTLPRVSKDMAAAAGIPVASAKNGIDIAATDIRPGDLVFFYHPVKHMGIALGDGKYLHAPGTGDVVKISVMGSTGKRPLTAVRRVV